MTTMNPRGADGRWTVDAATDDLRERIKAGEFSPADGSQGQLPPAATLGTQYKLSRNAANRVIDKLRQEGLVETRPGNRGAYVREWSPLVFLPQTEFEAPTSEDADILTRLVEAVRRSGETRMDGVTEEEASERIRHRLGLRDREHVAVRRRTSIVDGVAVHTDDSYVPLRLVDGTDWMAPGSVARGTNQVLAELGHEIVEAVDELRPRPTTEDENARLALGAGSIQAIEIVTTGFTKDARPVQVTVLALPAVRNTVVYKRRRPVPAVEADE
ncbi:GntR family transcriptional regulator [Streptomyces sp. H10-C2]|uniref:GntR family transcriptional regulator n=1 Tax=unclassified Streptomyces TaxID=2593676 RepID=UPI0024BB4251|nr:MULTISPECIES: GntR family transcriptional regulator [unclassified Streptomyces]MDJ0342799.1 GntR family transcriptional regulator [Streptomyces sp. PH10-H1]MDJ0372477.1 GntR family transcriptional regulator [Streptomyces sp. H10-C2]